MAWRLAPLGRILDVRPFVEFGAEHLSEVVNIPFAELPRRLHELPPKNETVEVLDNGPEAGQAVAFLQSGGRMPHLVSHPLPPPSFSRFSKTREGMNRLWRPNPFLEEVLPKLPVGAALDLACGSGREAVAMAAAGFEVTAVDLLADALDLGRDLAARYLIEDAPAALTPRERGAANEVNWGEGGAPIRWLQADLESLPPQPLLSRQAGTRKPIRFAKTGEGLALITAFRYLHRPLFAQIPDLLAPGGSFVFETFTVLHRERHGKPRQDAHVLRLGEAPSLVPGLKIVHFDEAWRGEIHTARLWARRGC